MKIPRLLAVVALPLLLLPAAFPATAQDEATGAPFFLLSDAAYGSDDVAMVRLEAQNMGAVAEYGGADIYVYRVRQPLEFLQRQKNLHRIDTAGNYAGPGLSNALARMWDNWWTGSRSAWRELFSADAREAVTAQAPETRSHPLAQAGTPVRLHPQYRPLQGHTLVASFRYPVHKAKPIQPPAGVKLAGSSSDFMPSPEGNVLIPLGRREPGLYLVEAMVGDYRAVTLVFVSNSIAVTKVSASQMLVWVADRRNGKPVRGAKTVWSDGVGVLATGGTDARGIVTFQRSAPEKTYVFGEDPQGGAYVAENYYYDSEIFNTKLYAVTDRPLYRPGETVFVKFVGRTFRSARESTPVEAGDLKLQVFDANGFPVAGQTLRMTPGSGGDTSFQLPDNAVAGGYELRFVFKGDAYGAAFRVAEYQKPHFEINVLSDQRDFKTNEEVKGRLQLVYPDGKPVANARADLSVRAQRLTMIEGDLGYTGQFPVQLTTASLVTDASGMASFVLPPAKEPSRYVLTVLATDGAAYRVRATKEILIERGAGTYVVTSERAFSAAGEDVVFGIKLLAEARAGIAPAPPVRWDWVRLENRKRDTGTLASGERFALAFTEPGTYTVSLHDAAGNIVGATSHYVSGGGVSAPQGSIEIVFEKSTYKPGETAAALITFPQKVDQALFTLERDRVEKTALMASASGWVRATRVSPTQWRAEIPVREDYGPNITFSVVFVNGGDYVFQNLGLKVEQPRIEVAVRPDKAVYAPGDKVTLDLTALIGGKPAPGAQLTVGVVDEMVYVLQPEIAPDIFDFFYHPRRNNVRTSASLAFIGYDLAKPPGKPAVPSRRQTHERTIKILERPRREDKDTAYWQPTLAVDGNGRASVSFIMPDSLTRWRVTVRAASAVGHGRPEYCARALGQGVLREMDQPDVDARTRTRPTPASPSSTSATPMPASSSTASGSGVNRRDTLNVKPGANFVSLPLHATGERRPRRSRSLALRQAGGRAHRAAEDRADVLGDPALVERCGHGQGHRAGAARRCEQRARAIRRLRRDAFPAPDGRPDRLPVWLRRTDVEPVDSLQPRAAIGAARRGAARRAAHATPAQLSLPPGADGGAASDLRLVESARPRRRCAAHRLRVLRGLAREPRAQARFAARPFRPLARRVPQEWRAALRVASRAHPVLDAGDGAAGALARRSACGRAGPRAFRRSVAEVLTTLTADQHGVRTGGRRHPDRADEAAGRLCRQAGAGNRAARARARARRGGGAIAQGWIAPGRSSAADDRPAASEGRRGRPRDECAPKRRPSIVH